MIRSSQHASPVSPNGLAIRKPVSLRSGILFAFRRVFYGSSPLNKRGLSFVALLLMAFIAQPSSSLRAVDFFWDADGDGTADTGGTGSLDTASSLWRTGISTGLLSTWSNLGVNNDAILGGTAGTLTLTSGISVNDITVNPTSGTSYIINGAQTLTLNGAAQPVIDVASGSSLTINSGLAGFSGFTKSSDGTLILDSTAGTSGLVGNITVNGGTLQAGSVTNNSSSQALRSNAVNLAGGTSLTTVGTTFDLRVGSLSGSGSVTPATGGAINLLARTDATFSGTVTTTGGLNLRGGNGTTQTFNGNLTGLSGTIGLNSGATLKLTGTGDSTSGVIGGTAIALRGGTFLLDNSGGNTSAATERVSNTAAVTLMGGKLSLIGNSAGTTETVGTFAMNSSSSTVSVTNNGGTGAQLTFTDSGGLRDVTSGTVNFVGLGTGTLGAAGDNPRITFTGAINTNTTNGMLANTSSATAATIGWARANTTSWAGIGANGIVALADTNRTSADLASATTWELTNLQGSATLAAPLTVGAMKLSPTGGSQSLDLNTRNLTTTAVMLTGTTDFAITGTTGGIASSTNTRYFYVTGANTTLSVSAALATANAPLNKSGAGILSLNAGTNQFSGATAVINVNVLEGVLRGTTTSLGGGTSADGDFTTINLYGGTLEISGGGTFTRALNVAGGAAGGGLKWDGGGTARGDGGFAAIGGNATVSLVTALGGATPATPIWNAGGMVSNGYALVLGSTTADSRIEFTNNIGLDDTSVSGGAANSYFAREVRVIDNAGSSTDTARLLGVISGSTNADLLKTGAGVLELTNSNTYAGNTIIQQGTLEVSANNALGTSAGSTTVVSGATLKLNAVSYLTGETLFLNGTGIANGGALVNSGTSTFAGLVTASTNATINTGGGTLNLTGGVVKDGTVLTFAGGGAVNVTGTGISGASPNSDLVVDGTTLVVGAASDYNGPTTVQNNGVLVANAGITTTQLTIDAGSTLSGTGSIENGAGLVTMNGALVVGDSTLGVPVVSQFEIAGTGSTVLGSLSILSFDLFTGAGLGDSTAIASSADRLKLFGTLDTTLGGTLVIGNPGAMTGFADGDMWTLFDLTSGGNFSGSFAALDYSALSLDPGLTGNFDNGTGVFSITAVPEPSRIMLLGFGLAGLLFRRRRS